MNITTKTLSGAEISVAIGGQNTEIRNDGAATVYASANSGIVAGADGVVAIPAGAAVTVLDTRGRVYLLGTGEVSVVGKDTVSAVFKCAPASGGSGGTIDTQARTLINNHVGNTAVHTTAAEKAVWNAAESNAKLYADSLFQSATNLELEIVTALPSNPATNKIYLIELSGSPGNYSEHIYINGAWVNVGTTAINLSQYYDIAQTNALLAQKASLSDIPTKTSELTNDSGFITSPDGGDADTFDGKHASEFGQNLGLWDSGDIKDKILGTDCNGFVLINSGVSGMPFDSTSWFGVVQRYSDNIKGILVYRFGSGMGYNLIYLNGTWIGWKGLADGGNAASVNGYSIEVTDVDPGEGVAMESGKIVMVVEP